MIQITSDESVPSSQQCWVAIGCLDYTDPSWSRLPFYSPNNVRVNSPVFVKNFNHFRLQESISDPSWRTSKSRGTQLIFKHRKIDIKDYLRIPVQPTYNPPRRWKSNDKPILKEPKIYPFFPPSRRGFESDSHYQARVKNSRIRYDNHLKVLQDRLEENYSKQLLIYYRRKERYLVKLTRYENAFKKRVQKYKKRLAILEKRRSIVKNWQYRDKTVVKRPTGLLTDHPYKRVIIENLGSNPIQVLGTYVAPLLNVTYQDFDPLTLLYWPTTFAIPPSPYDQRPWEQFLVQVERPFITNIVDYSEGDEYSVAVDSLISGILSSSAIERQTLEDRLVSKLSSKVRRLDINIGNILGERHKTIYLLSDALSRLRDIASGKKQMLKRFWNFAKNPKKISSDFLAFKFGVEPLIKDIHGLYGLLNSLESYDSDFVSFRVNNRIPINTAFSNQHGTFEFSGFMQMSFVVKYSVTSEWARLASRTGLINPFEIAWELLPWSFVVDWFIPVQQTLENLTSQTGMSFLTGTKKVRLFGNIRKIKQPGIDVNRCTLWETPVINFNFDSIAFESKNREVLSRPPSLPETIVFKQNPLTSTHLSEAFALGIQRVK